MHHTQKSEPRIEDYHSLSQTKDIVEAPYLYYTYTQPQRHVVRHKMTAENLKRKPRVLSRNAVINVAAIILDYTTCMQYKLWRPN